MPLLNRGPKLNFWRAPIDNDRDFTNDANKWRNKNIHMIRHHIENVSLERLDDHTVKVTVSELLGRPVFDGLYICDTAYTIDSNGNVQIETHGVPRGDWPPTIPRIGLQMTLPGNLDNVRWYGRGSGECYIDTKEAGRVGIYECKVEDLYTPYVFPQENGNRTDVRWVAMTNIRGMGLFAQGAPLLNFSAHWFTTQDLDNAKHTCDLVRRDEITFNLDYAQHCIGSASCGPGPLEQYWLKPEEFTFKLRLCPFSVDAISPQALARSK